MFRCQMCSTVVPAKTRTAKVVMATRPKVYEPRGQDPRERRGGRSFRGRRGPRKKKPYDKGGNGWEIVRELAVCPKCATEHVPVVPETPKPVSTLDIETAIEATTDAVTTETPTTETVTAETVTADAPTTETVTADAPATEATATAAPESESTEP